jgi:hypothetical protein
VQQDLFAGETVRNLTATKPFVCARLDDEDIVRRELTGQQWARDNEGLESSSVDDIFWVQDSKRLCAATSKGVFLRETSRWEPLQAAVCQESPRTPSPS